MEKPTPHYRLAVVKALVAAGRVRATVTALAGGVALGLDFEGMVGVVQGAVTMKCPACGAVELVRDIRELPYTYKGETTAIPSVMGDYCPACGESVPDAVESSRVSAAMLAFNRGVNASLVDPGFIVRVRKKLALDQREAAEIFGGGVNAFSRYENGKTKPPLALVKLLKVLDRHPELLEEIRAA